MAGTGKPASSRPGRCLCGAVRIEAVPASMSMGVCHCGMCRRWSGGTFMAVECTSVALHGDADCVGVFKSSDYGERVFCRVCGSSLVWRMQDGSAHVVSLKALDDIDGFVFESQIFIDEKPPLYAFADQTRTMTGAEFISAVTGKGA